MIKSDIDLLATYNAEVARGLVHSSEWHEKMHKLNEQFKRETMNFKGGFVVFYEHLSEREAHLYVAHAEVCPAYNFGIGTEGFMCQCGLTEFVWNLKTDWEKLGPHHTMKIRWWNERDS